MFELYGLSYNSINNIVSVILHALNAENVSLEN